MAASTTGGFRSWRRGVGLVVVVACFGASAGATVDLALGLGIHPWTAAILPISIEASIVLSGLAWHEGHKVYLARAVFWGFVTVTWLVNFVHAGGGFTGILAAMPTLSLPAGLHLAFDLPSGRRKPSSNRSSARRKPAAKPKADKPPVSTNGNGHMKVAKIGLDELRGMFDDLDGVMMWMNKYQTKNPGATQKQAWASIGVRPDTGSKFLASLRKE